MENFGNAFPNPWRAQPKRDYQRRNSDRGQCELTCERWLALRELLLMKRSARVREKIGLLLVGRRMDRQDVGPGMLGASDRCRDDACQPLEYGRVVVPEIGRASCRERV